jgi:hypothetical protein
MDTRLFFALAMMWVVFIILKLIYLVIVITKST